MKPRQLAASCSFRLRTNEAFDNMNIYIQEKIDLSNVYVVWSCKTLQNYKALLSTSVSGDGIYVEFTYNGDKQELYMDVYHKIVNQKITEGGCSK